MEALRKPIKYFNVQDMPLIAMAIYSIDLLNDVLSMYESREIFYLRNANGIIKVYEIYCNNKSIAVFLSPMGAGHAVIKLEDVMVYGIKEILYFGSCGVLEDIDNDSIIIPNIAYIDEAVSKHYNKYECVNLIDNSRLINYCNNNEIKYCIKNVYTLEALYRETNELINKIQTVGCSCIDMECSALTSAAAFHDIKIYYFFYPGDYIQADKYDERILKRRTIEEYRYFFNLALSFLLTRYDEYK